MSKMLSTITLFGLLTVSDAQAQSNEPIQARVPFAFMAHDTMLASGNYQLTYSSNAHILSIRGLNQDSSGTFAIALPVTSEPGPGKFIFRCYDKSCYLAQLSYGTGLGLSLPQSAKERKLAFVTHVASITIPTK
jgi:hypothetical protein